MANDIEWRKIQVIENKYSFFSSSEFIIKQVGTLKKIMKYNFEV